MPEPASRLLNAVRQRVRRTEQSVTALQLDIERRKRAQLTSPEDVALLERLEKLLAAHIAERDAARKELEALAALPAWQLAQMAAVGQGAKGSG